MPVFSEQHGYQPQNDKRHEQGMDGENQIGQEQVHECENVIRNWAVANFTVA